MDSQISLALVLPGPFQTINGSFEGVVDCKEVPCINTTQRYPVTMLNEESKNVPLKPLLQEINTWCTTVMLTLVTCISLIKIHYVVRKELWIVEWHPIIMRSGNTLMPPLKSHSETLHA